MLSVYCAETQTRPCIRKGIGPAIYEGGHSRSSANKRNREGGGSAVFISFECFMRTCTRRKSTSSPIASICNVVNSCEWTKMLKHYNATDRHLCSSHCCILAIFSKLRYIHRSCMSKFSCLTEIFEFKSCVFSENMIARKLSRNVSV